MEFLAGRTLAQMVECGPLGATEAALQVRKGALAIRHACECGVLHRDLKPPNLLVDAAAEPRVTDFGSAKRLDAELTLIVTGQLLGSAHDLAP